MFLAHIALENPSKHLPPDHGFRVDDMLPILFHIPFVAGQTNFVSMVTGSAHRVVAAEACSGFSYSFNLS